jgi:type III restriction enzyme
MASGSDFHRSPILNSPYEVPRRHWVLDESRQPTDKIDESRRRFSFITPIPKARKAGRGQDELALSAEAEVLATAGQQYELAAMIDSLRQELAAWRALPENRWRVTPETARLLKHWRHHQFGGIRPFFCQVEAVETAIWLTEVAPRLGNQGRKFLDQIDKAREDANPLLSRIALKLATGAGKTAVMAMLIAWQTVNAVRHPGSTRFTRGFLVVAPHAATVTVHDAEVALPERVSLVRRAAIPRNGRGVVVPHSPSRGVHAPEAGLRARVAMLGRPVGTIGRLPRNPVRRPCRHGT